LLEGFPSLLPTCSSSSYREGKSPCDISMHSRCAFLLIFTLRSCSWRVLHSLRQRTVVQESGGGRKLELHYNAAEQVPRSHDWAPMANCCKSKILSIRGAYVPQTTPPPTGRMKSPQDHARYYDNNANFTGEFIQVFDEAGKQISGHQLVHDPQTNFYHCADWNVSAQKYQTIDCPAAKNPAALLSR